MSVSESIWQVEVDRATTADWSQMLDLFDDANIYQTAAYGSVRWGERNLSRLVLKRDGEVVGIAQFRIIRPTPLKFGMAYLRWGPLWERRGRVTDPEVPIRLARAIEEEYLKRRRLYLRIIPNAFVESSRAQVLQSVFSGFTRESQEPDDIDRTFLMDLTPTLEELRSRLDKKWRNQLSRAERNELTVKFGRGRDDYRSFRSMYDEMYKRKGFETTVDAEEFGRIHEALSESQSLLVFSCYERGVAAAGLVATAIGDSAIYLLGATSDAGLNSKAAYLLQWTLIDWLKRHGINQYDLGGINPEGNPGVYHFKKGLSGADICRIGPFAASRSVVSSGIVRAGLALRYRFRSTMKPPGLEQSIKLPASS